MGTRVTLGDGVNRAREDGLCQKCCNLRPSVSGRQVETRVWYPENSRSRNTVSSPEVGDR